MTDPAELPLGRYMPPTDAADRLHEVHLIGMPVALYLESRERHDELVREFSLLALATESSRRELPAQFVELVEVLGVRYGSATARPEREVELAAEQGRTSVDLTYQVPAGVVEAAAELERWLTLADAFCASEQLLTLPRRPELLRMSRWYFEQFRRQVDGEPAQPYAESDGL